MEAQQIGVATSSGKTNSAKHADDTDASRTTEAGQRRYCFFYGKKRYCLTLDISRKPQILMLQMILKE
jgi:hypothetical protein